MKTTLLTALASKKTILLSASASGAFICSYFWGLALDNAEQFLAIGCVILLDGFFGVCAGVKREGFKTFKAIKVLRTLATWWVVLAVILTVENAFVGASWLSETMITPLLIFQLISALKNASLCGYIKIEVLNKILEKIDKHKDS